jgi:hypothetical protein
MSAKMLHRIGLALIPVALLTSVSLAFSVMSRPAAEVTSTPPAEESVVPVVTPLPPTTPAEDTSKRPVTGPAPEPDAIAQTDEQQHVVIQEIAEEPLPELVIDKTALHKAMADLDRAMEQAKLAVTALDADAQARYVQETINVLGGYADPAFRATAAASSEMYPGVRPLLIEARVVREAVEVQWIAAVQRQLEARAKKLAEIAQAGGTITVPMPPASIDLSATVGPAGVLGTRGVRPEEQALEIVSRTIRQSADALRAIPQAGATVNVEMDGTSRASDQATSVMEYVVRQLETARKIIQIAIDR